MSDDLAFDGVCPVCGDEFTAPAAASIETATTYDATVCILPREHWQDGDPQFLVHLPEVASE